MLKGQHFQSGSRKVDFIVTVGEAKCDILDLHDNQVNCRPPLFRPPKKANDSFCHADKRSLEASKRLVFMCVNNMCLVM